MYATLLSLFLRRVVWWVLVFLVCVKPERGEDDKNNKTKHRE